MHRNELNLGQHTRGSMLENKTKSSKRENWRGWIKSSNLPRRVSRLQGVVDASEKCFAFLNKPKKGGALFLR
jgi:hypothetical protein